MNRRQLATPLLVIVLALAPACSPSAEEVACLDTCEALSRAFEGCGYDYASTYDQCVAGAHCDDAARIRDEDELRNECFPALETLDCPSLEAGALPASCQGQILL